MMLTAKKPAPTVGTIQWILSRAVHPYQNKQIGRQTAPKNVGTSTVSGLKVGLVIFGTIPYLTHSKKRGSVMMPPTRMLKKTRPCWPM